MSSKSIVWLLAAAALVGALLLWRSAPAPAGPAAATPAASSADTVPAASLPPVTPPAEPPPSATPSARVVAAATAVAEPPRPLAPGVVPIQDQKTIDFSSGQAVVKNDSAEKAAIEAALKEMDEATKGVTFGPNSGPAAVK
jgi:hypothetical protein